MPKQKVNAYEIGEYIDEWGCVFINIHHGIIGEVKNSLVIDDNWNNVENVHIHEKLLTFSVDEVNIFCKNSDKFMLDCYCYRQKRVK